MALLPVLPNGAVVAMDSNKSKIIQEAVEAAGYLVEYLPPYSLDLNPIEHNWAALRRKLGCSTDDIFQQSCL